MRQLAWTQFAGRVAFFSFFIILAGCGGGGTDTQAPSEKQSAIPLTAQVSDEKVEESLSAADQYFNSGEVDKARAILAVLIDRAPNDGRSRELFGQTLALMASQAQGKGDERGAAEFRYQAFEQYAVAVELNPDSAGLRHSAGLIAFTAGHIDEALTLFLDAGRLDPQDPRPPLYAAQILIQRMQLDEAEAQLKLVQQLDDDEPLVFASLAIIAMHREQYDVARRLIAQARTINPHDLGLLVQEARIHRRAGNPRRSVEMLVLLNDQQKAQLAMAEELAAGFEAIGEPEKAAEVWTNRIRVNRGGSEEAMIPDAWRDALRAAEAYLKAGKRETALSWLEIARMQAPEAVEVAALEAKFAES